MKRSLRLCHPPPIRNTEAVPPASMPATAAGTGEHRELSQGVPPAGDAAAWPQSPTGQIDAQPPWEHRQPLVSKKHQPRPTKSEDWPKSWGIVFLSSFFFPFLFILPQKTHCSFELGLVFNHCQGDTLCLFPHAQGTEENLEGDKSGILLQPPGSRTWHFIKAHTYLCETASDPKGKCSVVHISVIWSPC